MSRAEEIRAEAVKFLLSQSLRSFFSLGMLDLRRAKGPFLIDSVQEFEKRTGFRPGDVEGMALRRGRIRVILYDGEGRSRERRNFTIAHEIGHLMLGHDGTGGESEEREANRFASEVLIPRAAVLGWEKREGARMSADEMAAQFAASGQACVRRREELDRDTLPLTEDERRLYVLLFSGLSEKRAPADPDGAPSDDGI